MKRITINYDGIGIITSTLCAIHCIATPFLFLVKACSFSCCSEAPIWWTMFDYIFLMISFIAIYFITINLNVKWLNISLWTTWIILLFTILNQSFEIVSLPKYFIYIPTSLIIILHLYNLKYCKCKNDSCCVQ